jgi:nucleobase:cation symporter-1, NCS1 family
MARNTTRTVFKTGVASDEVFKVESHGIDRIPLADRHGHPSELFWVWLGGNIVYTYVIFGALLVSFGLPFWGALVAAVVGNLFYVMVGIGSVSGPPAGAPTLVIARSIFGRRGNLPLSLLQWFTGVGFEAVNAVIGSLALLQLAVILGIPATSAVKAVCLGLLIAVTLAVAALGHATLVIAQRVFSILLGAATIGVGAVVLTRAHLGIDPALGAPTQGGAWLLAIFLVATGPISYMGVTADYTRYMAPEVSSRKIVLWTALGGFIPSFVLTAVGAAAATAADMSDPVAGLIKIIPTWLGVIYALLIVGGTLTNNFINLYSSGLGLQVLGLRVARAKTIFIDAAVTSVAAAYALFVSDFTASLLNLLSLMILWIGPWSAIYLINILLKRNEYNSGALYQERGGSYWYWHGWSIAGLIALAIGVVSAAMFANAPLYKGPFVHLIGGGDASVFVGMLVAGLVYYGLALVRRRRLEYASSDAASILQRPAEAR